MINPHLWAYFYYEYKREMKQRRDKDPQWVTGSGVVHLSLDPVTSSTSLALNSSACAAEAQHQEAEAAYGKHSSPEAVKTFIIITNLQAPTEPGGVEAAKQTLHLPGSHILPRCIRGLEGAFFAGHTKSYLLACISLLCLSPRLRDRIKGVCVCVCQSKLFVPALHCVSKQDEIIFLCSCSYNRCMPSCVFVSVCYWMESGCVYVCVASAVMKRSPPRPPLPAHTGQT